MRKLVPPSFVLRMRQKKETARQKNNSMAMLYFKDCWYGLEQPGNFENWLAKNG